MTDVVPFNQRFGTGLPDSLLDKEVPESARVGLIGILSKLENTGYISSWGSLATEALHTAQRLRKEFVKTGDEDLCTDLVMQMEWNRFYAFCERVYRILQPPQCYDDHERDIVVTGSLENAKAHTYYSARLKDDRSCSLKQKGMGSSSNHREVERRQRKPCLQELYPKLALRQNAI